MPDELGEQPIAVRPIGLHVLEPPAHLDRGGVRDLVLEAVARQVPVHPEAVPSRLVATQHPGRGGEPQGLFRPRHLASEPRQIRRRHRYLPALGAVAERQSPALVAQLQRHVQHRHRCVTFHSLARGFISWLLF